MPSPFDRFDLYAGIGDDDDRCGFDPLELQELAALDSDDDCGDDDEVLTAEELSILRATCD